MSKEQAHDSGDVAVRDRRLHGWIVASASAAPQDVSVGLGVCAGNRRGYEARMHWIWLIIVGAIVGALGRLFHPGSDPMGWVVTILIGIASLVIAGIIFSSGWLQFIVGVIVAVILVALVGRFFGGRRSVLT
jgi:uncharacterized membrane protein YeaQ/YmgE (transglycosylase-associated protein family)